VLALKGIRMSEQKEKRGSFYFSTLSYPTFGRGAYSEDNPPTTVTSSPYYWWFKFLQLNEDYKKTLQAKGKGRCSELYKDFGDVYKVDFKEWWKDKEVTRELDQRYKALEDGTDKGFTMEELKSSVTKLRKKKYG
jgi:hypothetical protein